MTGESKDLGGWLDDRENQERASTAEARRLELICRAVERHEASSNAEMRRFTAEIRRINRVYDKHVNAEAS